MNIIQQLTHTHTVPQPPLGATRSCVLIWDIVGMAEVKLNSFTEALRITYTVDTHHQVCLHTHSLRLGHVPAEELL